MSRTSSKRTVAVSDVHHVDVRELLQRTDVLSRYLSDGRKQLEALWALEDVLERMEHPHSQCPPYSQCPTQSVSHTVRPSPPAYSHPACSRLSSVFADVLRLLFDILFDEAIVEEDTFYTWKVDAERRGRAAALRSVTDFFSWLHR